MERILKIEGMMCPHCEANVKSTLEGLEGVISAEVSHHKNTAVVKAEKEIDDELLKNAVEDKGYKVISID